jgi:type II secretory pathway component PulF
MFEKAIEQIKEWYKDDAKSRNKTDSVLILPGMGLPTLMLIIWCICALFLTYSLLPPRTRATFAGLLPLLS